MIVGREQDVNGQIGTPTLSTGQKPDPDFMVKTSMQEGPIMSRKLWSY